MPIRTLAIAGLLTIAGVAAGASQNPMLPGADPELVIACGAWWLYPTTQRDPAEGGGQPTASFYAWQSSDLTRWRQSAPVLRMADIKWIGDDGAPHHALWAPSLARANGRFYLYYSVGPQNPTPSRIGVAIGASPAGPFTDAGRPVLTGGRGFEAIDPMVFVDPQGRGAYLYAGGSAGAKLRVFQLDAGLTRIAREVKVRTPPQFTEGAFVHERNGVYYLSYSHGRWNGPDYSVHYATGPGPEGPWTYRGAILTSDATHQGPGHHSFVKNDATGEWFIAYHRWERTNRTAPFQGRRAVAVQPIRYNEQGLIEAVRMTDEAPPRSVPAAQDCSVASPG